MRKVNSHLDKPKLAMHKNRIKYNSGSEQSDTEEESLKKKKILKNKALLKDISKTLITIIFQNKNPNNQKDVFSRGLIPRIFLIDYLIRIQEYSGIENSTIIIALIYIDRICVRKRITLTKFNIHRLLITSILISIKFNEDIIYDNLYYSKIYGIALAQLNIFENEFLKMIGFDLFVSEEVYKKYYSHLNIDKNPIND